MTYVPDTIILKTRSSQGQGHSDLKWYVTLRHPMMHFHTNFGIATSKNIRDMLCTK